MSFDLDMDEICQVFFEESCEGLDVMEAGLLNLDLGAPDSEVVNEIFRAAHSIKGGAGTFGFMEISDFTHGVETLLDEMRSGARDVTAEIVQLLLQSVDHLRAMIDTAQRKEEIDTASGDALQQAIAAVLEQSANTASPDEELVSPSSLEVDPDEPTSGRLTSSWKIEFRPHPQMLQSGNDPVRIFRELRSLGDLAVSPALDRLPALAQMDPEVCYLAWTLMLRGSVTREQILEVFDWVIGECDLDISQAEPESKLQSDASSDSETAQAPGAETVTPDQSAVTGNDAIERAAKKQSAATEKGPQRESASIRVSIDKVDTLLNLVGELVITQSMLNRFRDSEIEELKELTDGLTQLERYTRELQESAMQIRMLPISFTFGRFPRLVHDMSAKLGKKVDLQLSGGQTELDKTVLEKIGDPLVHLVRNSLDHGIESPEVRREVGKPETGVLHLSAFHEGGNIVIRLADDGAGLNRAKILEKARDRGLIGADEQLSDERIDNLIFQAGFSTVDEVSDLSGRGVGMDVVRRNVKDLGGRVDVQSSPGKGTTFTIRLPLTLAILDGQLVRLDAHTYIIPLVSIVETVLTTPEQVNDIARRANVYKLRDEYIPAIGLRDTFGIGSAQAQNSGGLLVVVEADGRQVGLFVDELLEQQQVVIKSLEDNFRHVQGVSGATILGDGAVALILDVPGLIQGISQSAVQTSEARRHAA